MAVRGPGRRGSSLPAASVTSAADRQLAAARAALARNDLAQAARLAARARKSASETQCDVAIAAAELCCGLLYREGRWKDYLAEAEAVMPLLGGAQHQPVKLDLLRRMTLAASELARFDVALHCAHEAWKTAQQQQDAGAIALSLTTQAMAMERIGDPWQAMRLLESALESSQRVRDPYVRLVVHNTLCVTCIGTYYLVREWSPPSEMRRLLNKSIVHAKRARKLLPRVPQGTFFAMFVDGNLGESLVHAGRLDEAEPLLRSSIDSAKEFGASVHAWRARCGWGELLLARGEHRQAYEQLLVLWEEMQGAGSEHHNTLLRLHHGLFRACKGLRLADDALTHLEAYERLARERSVVQLRAQSELFVTRTEAEQSRREAQAERERAKQLEQEASRDTLTGLGNRRHLERRLPALLAAARRAHQPVAVAVLDLDHFKRINDRYGHPLGDAVLVRLARLLEQHTRSSDLVIRLGGEEFLVVFDRTSTSVAYDICERLRLHVAAHDWAALAPELGVTVSIGVAVAPPHDSAALFEAADRALYAAKAQGRNRVVA